MYLGKVEIHHKDLFKTPNVYEVRGKGGKLFKSKKQATNAAKKIGRIKINSKKYPVGSHIAYSAEHVNVIDPKKENMRQKDFNFGFGDFF